MLTLLPFRTAPPQTVCDVAEASTVTVVTVMPQQTEIQLTYVTTETRATIWVAYVLVCNLHSPRLLNISTNARATLKSNTIFYTYRPTASIGLLAGRRLVWELVNSRLISIGSHSICLTSHLVLERLCGLFSPSEENVYSVRCPFNVTQIKNHEVSVRICLQVLAWLGSL